MFGHGAAAGADLTILKSARQLVNAVIFWAMLWPLLSKLLLFVLTYATLFPELLLIRGMLRDVTLLYKSFGVLCPTFLTHNACFPPCNIVLIADARCWNDVS